MTGWGFRERKRELRAHTHMCDMSIFIKIISRARIFIASKGDFMRECTHSNRLLA